MIVKHRSKLRFFNFCEDSSMESSHNLSSLDISGLWAEGSTLAITSDTGTFNPVTVCLLRTTARTKLSDRLMNSCSR
ncbi:GSCOCG00002488001-RA-CDS [Cotesia congregata]|nr:GSCOCG00002488001-RA-CDS [Cotesia congregata]